MQAVERVAVATVGGLTDHDRVIPVFLGHIGAVAVLTMQDGVIRDHLLEAVFVDDRQEGVKHSVTEAQTIHLH